MEKQAHPRGGRDAERRRQAQQLALAVAAASRLPQRDPGPLRFPSFRSLTRR